MDTVQDNVDFHAQISYFMCRHCTPSWVMEKQQIRFHDLTLLLDGEAEYIINGVHYKVSAGDLIYTPKGATRQAVTFPDRLMKCYCIDFHLRNYQGEEEFLPFPTVSHIGLKRDILSLFEDAFHEWSYHFPGFRLKVQGYFLLIIRRLFGMLVFKNDLATTDSRIQKVLRHIIDHYDESLQIKDLADRFNMSPVYLGTLFKQIMGVSFHQYLLEIRLSNVENILLGGGHTIKEAAILCGFHDAFHLSKEFKKSRGISPSELFKPAKGKAIIRNSSEANREME